MEFLLNNKNINLNDFLQHMNSMKEYDEDQPIIEELSEKDSNDTIDDKENSEEESIESSNLSVEEEISEDFYKEKLEEDYKGFVPYSLINKSIYKEILNKEEDLQERRKLLLYFSFKNKNIFQELEIFKSNLLELEIFTNSLVQKFLEIERRVYWKFYKFLESDEFEELIFDKIIESNNLSLFAYHLYFRKIDDFNKKDLDNKIYDYRSSSLSEEKKRDEKNYKDLVHSLFQEIYA